MNDKRSLAQKFEEKITQNGQNLTFENNFGAPIQVQPVMQVEVPAGDPRVIKARHEQSVKTYPDIPVDEDEICGSFDAPSLTRLSFKYYF